jgi:hypothetical protein
VKRNTWSIHQCPNVTCSLCFIMEDIGQRSAWSFMSSSVSKTSTTAHWPTLLHLFFSGTYRLSLSHTEKNRQPCPSYFPNPR